MVGRIENGTQRVVEAMRLGNEATVETVNQTEAASLQMDQLVEAVRNIGVIAEAIADASNRQLNTAQEAKSSMLSMMELNASAIDNAKDHTVSTDDLVKLAHSLKEKLDRFVLSDPGWNESMRYGRRPADHKTQPTADPDEILEDAAVELF